MLNVYSKYAFRITHSPGHADYAGRIVNMMGGRVLQERRRAA